MSTCRAFWIVEPHRGELRDEPIKRAPAADEVTVRTLYSGISRGTENLVFSGKVPQAEYDRMRAPFQVGDFPGPLKYGYINVGEIESGPAAWLGKKVFCLYPHQTRFVVPASAVFVLPDAVPPTRAVLAANMETAVNGLWDGAPKVGDEIAVFGAGVTGTLIARLAAQLPGCEVTLIDINPEREQIAEALGVKFQTPTQLDKEFDLLFNVSGSEDALNTALRHAGFEATVVELSWFGDQITRLSLGERFHSQRLTIRSSQVGSVATAQRPRWTNARRMRLALSLLRDSALDVVITGESSFNDLPQVMAQATRATQLCHRIRYDEY